MRKNNRKRKGGFLMTTGLLLIAAALLLTLYNDREQKLADAQAAAALSRLRVTIPEAEEEQDAPVLSDERGNPLDWPLDAKGEPMPWPVAEDGMPVPSVTDGGGRTVYWAGLRGAAAQQEQTAAPAVPADGSAPAAVRETAAPETGIFETDVQETAVPDTGAQSAGGPETAAPGTVWAETDMPETASQETAWQEIPSLEPDGQAADDREALAGWTVDAQGALLPWIRDAAGRLTPWPTDSAGRVLSWTQLRQNWLELLEALSPYLALATLPPFVRYPDMEMPTRTVDGQTYIGVVEVPSLELSLPVISEWSYPRLKKSPCRYVGSVYSKDMVICGHNYDRHFGRLKDLTAGDEVRFTDLDGNVFLYSVCGMEQLAKNAVDDMLAGEWDLTLFTCTKGGRTRVTVRCRLERYVVGGQQEDGVAAQITGAQR